MLEAVVLLLSLFSLVRCCPYVVEPSSLNVSQGTPAQFSVVVCGSSATLVVWAVDNVVYVNGYNFNGTSVVQEALSGNRVRSNLTIATNSTELDNTLGITSTVYAPQAVPSGTVILRIQGLLAPVIDFNYNVINQRLSWMPPFTLSGVPISHYMIIINNNNLPLFTINSSLTTLDLNGTPCQHYNAIIAAVNAVGEGQSVSLNYTHVGVPDVYYINNTGTINNETFAIEVSYEIRFNCTEQIPDKVNAVTRNMYSNSDMTHSNQTVNYNGMMTGNALNGSYSIDELLTDDTYVGQLVFETEQGLTIKTMEFNLWTFDLNSVTITPNNSEVCVTVSYTSGSEALGFIIKTLTRQWNITRNHTNTTCVSLTDGVHQVRVFDWNTDGSIPGKWRKEATVTISLPHTSQSHSSTHLPTPHIGSSSTVATSVVANASTKYVSSSILSPTASSTVGTTNNTRPAAKNNSGVIAGVTVAVLLPIAIALIVAIIVFVLIWKRRKGKKYNASWRPSSWTDYNEPSDYPTSTTDQPWTGVRLTEVVDSPATDTAADTQATDSTALSEKATGSYLTDCTVTEQDPPPYSSHYVVPHGSQSHFPTQRETTSNETLPSGKESHYADIQVGGKQAAGRKSHNKLQERVVYSKIKAPPYALPPKSKGAQPRNLNIAVPFSRHSSGQPRQDQGYSSSNQQSSSDAPHDYGAGAVTYLSASQQAQNNNDDSFSLVASNPAHIDQLQHPAVSSTNSHSNYSKNTSSTTTVC